MALQERMMELIADYERLERQLTKLRQEVLQILRDPEDPSRTTRENWAAQAQDIEKVVMYSPVIPSLRKQLEKEHFTKNKLRNERERLRHQFKRTERRVEVPDGSPREPIGPSRPGRHAGQAQKRSWSGEVDPEGVDVQTGPLALPAQASPSAQPADTYRRPTIEELRAQEKEKYDPATPLALPPSEEH